MQDWFQTRVKYLKKNENGLISRITEQYLVNAMSFTEAEARIIMEVSSGNREITMASIAKSNIQEVVFYGDTDRWHKAKVTYVVSDDESEKQKKVTTYLLVNSEDVKEAFDRVQEHLKEMLVPFEVPKIEESPIVEVYGFLAGFRGGLRKVEEGGLEDSEDSLPDRPKPVDRYTGDDVEGDFKAPVNDSEE